MDVAPDNLAPLSDIKVASSLVPWGELGWVPTYSLVSLYAFYKFLILVFSLVPLTLTSLILCLPMSSLFKGLKVPWDFETGGDDISACFFFSSALLPSKVADLNRFIFLTFLSPPKGFSSILILSMRRASFACLHRFIYALRSTF